VPTNRTPIARRHRGLSHFEQMSLEYGEAAHRSGFESEEARREAWFRNRDHILAGYQHGRRPAAWWDYESPIARPHNYEYEVAVLFEAELLSAEEKADRIANWRSQFDKAQEPGFMFCIGHAKPDDTFATWLTGAPARRAHYEWAGIPRDLIRHWTAERRRRKDTPSPLDGSED
jgi:hypothetical protein